jgi:hypothetical protein
MGLTTPHSKKLTVTKVEQRNKLDWFNDDGGRWKELVIGREKWRGTVRQAKPTAGCSANGRRRIITLKKYKLYNPHLSEQMTYKHTWAVTCLVISFMDAAELN